MKAIEVIGISKNYGATAALDDVSFDIEEGDAVALVGPNGAGKTTLLRVLATLVKPTRGYARVKEMDGRFQAPQVRANVGYMPDAFGMYDDLDVGEYLEFFAGVYGLDGKTADATVRDLIALLDLKSVQGRPTHALSRGMQQRVALARTLIHDPSILLLDEPAANLDPRSRIEIREILKELHRMGKTIFISSHILMELGELCDKLLLMDKGKILYFGRIADIASRLRPHKEISVRVEGDHKRLGELLRMEKDVEEVTESDGLLQVRLREGVEDYSLVVRRAVEAGMKLLLLREEEPGLEEVFMRLTQK